MSFTHIDFDKDYNYDDITEHHLGKLTLAQMKRNPNGLHQIDMVEDIRDTHDNFRILTVRVAEALKSRNIGIGDIISLCAPNHRFITLPIIASLYIGSTIYAFAENQTERELGLRFSMAKPRIIFCDSKNAQNIQAGAKEVGHDMEIVVFDDDFYGNFTPFKDFLQETGTEDNFQPTEFDPNETNAFIITSSGTSGPPKGVCLTHKHLSLVIQIPGKHVKQQKQWYSLSFFSMCGIAGVMSCLASCLSGDTRLYCQENFSIEILFEAIKKYKPNCGLLTEFIVANIVSHPNIKDVDFGCFKTILILGTMMSDNLKNAFQKIAYNAFLKNDYGMTESGGPFMCLSKGDEKFKSSGKVLPWISWKVVDVETEKKLGPNQYGELWGKGPTIFKEYYKDLETTKLSFSEDGWFKTGDLVYYDEYDNIYIIERIKALIKVEGTKVITPSELELLIEQLEGVFKACVVGKSDENFGELPIAFVQKKPGCSVTEESIKNIIKENLSDHKHLRGGVVFIDQLPKTPTGKINRKAVKLLADNCC